MALTPPAPCAACAGVVLSRLRVGMRAFVSTDTSYPNALRTSPEKDSALLGELLPGTVFQVTGGPQCAGGLSWWQVCLEDGALGWTAEGDADSYWLSPCPTSGACQPK